MTTAAQTDGSHSASLDDLVDRRSEGDLFRAAAREVASSVADLIDRNELYRVHRVFERLLEPDRVIRFRIEWVDGAGRVQVNRGWRVEHSNALGPYKGGLRFHPTVTEDTLRFLAFEQTFKNALTGLPLGGGKGGSDFDPKGKSDFEVMSFCQSMTRELHRHIGAWTDVPAGDIGVGGREVGYLYGAYLKITRRHGGVLTGKPEVIGGLPGRSEATGYGTVEFARAMLEHAGDGLDGKRVVISGAGNVAIYAAERAMQLGGRVVAMSDSGGVVVCEDGLSEEQLGEIRELKEERRGRLSEYESSGVSYHEDATTWTVVTEGLECGVALPCATQHEIDGDDAKGMVDRGVRLVAEGANMPCTHEAFEVFRDSKVLFAPGKAANAGGVAASGFEMSQNSAHESWTKERTLGKLSETMKSIHAQCVEYGRDGDSVDYVKGANAAAFVRVADAILAMGV